MNTLTEKPPSNAFGDIEIKILSTGGRTMDVNPFCGMMHSEITSLKARVYDITRAVEKIKDKKKKKQVAQVTDLHALIDHLSELTRKLENECPLDWSREREEIETKKLN